jgi:hypothetical protein
MQPILTASGRHELPKPCGALGRYRLWVVRALDDGKQSDFSGHPALLELANDEVKIRSAALDHTSQMPRALHVLRLVT